MLESWAKQSFLSIQVSYPEIAMGYTITTLKNASRHVVDVKILDLNFYAKSMK